MLRYTLLGTLTCFALALSPATPTARADDDDWEDYWEDRQERYEDWLEDQRDNQRRWQRRYGNVYPSYYGNYGNYGYTYPQVVTWPTYSTPYYPSFPQYSSGYQYYRPGGVFFRGRFGRGYSVRW